MKTIPANEHVFIAGMTQSGKTFLTQIYTANMTNQIYVLDTKGLFNWSGFVDQAEITVVTNIKDLPNTKTKKVIYRPVWEELEQTFYNSFFEFCMRRKNCVIIVDEVMQVCPNPQKIPEWYKGALTRGMELGVGVWSLTQRPTNIPVTCLSESTHYFIFRLNSLDDRKRIVDYTGQRDFLEIIPKREFWYYNTVSGKEPILSEIIIKRKGAGE